MSAPSLHAVSLLEALARLCGVGVVVLDPEGKARFASQAALDLLGHHLGNELRGDWPSLEARLPALRFQHQPIEGGEALVLVGDPARPGNRQHDELMARRAAVTADIEHLIAHDLRAPLNAIQLGVEFLEGAIDDAGARTEPCVRHLAMIREEITRMSRLLEQRLEGPDPMSPAASDFDLRDVLTEASRLALNKLRAAGARLRSDMPEEPLPVRGSSDRLRLAVLEVLLQCARDAVDGDCVVLTAQKDDDCALVRIDARAAAGAEQQDALSRVVSESSMSAGAGLHAAATLLAMSGGSLSVARQPEGQVRYEARLAFLPTSGIGTTPPSDSSKVRVTG